MTVTLLIVSLLIIIGLALLIVEFFMIPGISIAGIAGTLFTIGGIVYAYRHLGMMGGHITLASTIILGVILMLLSFRAKTWDRLSLKSAIDSSVETVEINKINIGDVGITISRLNPMGKAMVNEMVMEARCPGQFIDENKAIEVVKVFKTYIIVKLKN